MFKENGTYRLAKRYWDASGISRHVLESSNGIFTAARVIDDGEGCMALFPGSMIQWNVGWDWVEHVTADPVKQAVDILKSGKYALHEASIVQEAIDILEGM